MSESSTSMLLVGIGTSGCRMAQTVADSFDGSIRYILADTDAKSGALGGPFTLIGGDRLAGNGAGGDMVSARLAAEDSLGSFDTLLEGVRLAVIVTALGGGTGSGATIETVKHLRERGIPTCVFATTPFAFEGEERHRTARGVMSLIEDDANASFFMPLDKLVGDDEQQMGGAMRKAVEIIASGITLFWRLVERPGYIRLDAERMRHIVAVSGKGRFATVIFEGENRAERALAALCSTPLLSIGSGPVKSMLCGVLAGDDLKLSEVGRISDGLRKAFGETATFELATVNDEATFGGRLAIVLMLFESGGRKEEEEEDPENESETGRRRRKQRALLGTGPTGRGKFTNAEATIWNGEDLDIPTFIRREINLDF